jgi:hypothetical protein
MQTLTTTFEAPRLAEVYIMNEPLRKDIQIPEERELSVRQASHYIGKTPFRETGYNTTTYGHIGFARIEPEEVTEDVLLQARLDILCEKLRARY